MMQNKLIVAITGGIGSGKSAFSKILQEKGYPVFSCDKIYSELLERNYFLADLKKAFPACVDEKGLNRAMLSKCVFSDSTALKKLNAITHPAIMKELFCRAEHDSVSFAEVPLLYEEGLENLFDAVIALRRPYAERVSAVKLRDGITEREIAERVKRQFNQDDLSHKDCILIENDGTLSDLEKKADYAIQALKERFSELF